MEEKKFFDPSQWLNSTSDNVQPANMAAPVMNPTNSMPSAIDNELEKARAVCSELLQRGANIADDEGDYFRLIESMVDLGNAGKELCRQLCQQSMKYDDRDFEYKWKWAMNNSRRTIHIGTFYDMAQKAGVDLSALSRIFPSLPSFPHPSNNTGASGVNLDYNMDNTYNNQNISIQMGTPSNTNTTYLEEGGGMRDVRESTYSDTFSDKLNPASYPELLRRVEETQSSPENKDKVILGTLGTVSGKMPNVLGTYSRKRLYTPLFLMFGAPSARAEKGVVNDCRQLLMPIEQDLMHQYDQEVADYELQLAAYENKSSKERKNQPKPKEPVRRTVFIPANSSATYTYQNLSDNGGEGIIFETEADTLTEALKQDYGNYSDGLRKAYAHETISYGRRTEKEYVYVDKPRLAVLLTCTPGQIPLLLPSNNVENGLANRFVFYLMKGIKGWRSPWGEDDEPMDEIMFAIGKDFQQLYQDLLKRKDCPIEFTLTQEQKEEFNSFFEPLYNEQIALYGEDIDAFIFRLGVTTFRLAMVLSVLRCYENRDNLSPENKVLVCRQEDFITALTIANTLINHTAYVYNNLLQHQEHINPQVAAMLPQEQQLYTAMNDEFTTQDCLRRANELGISRSTAERYIGKFCSKYMVAQRTGNGRYKKILHTPVSANNSVTN